MDALAEEADTHKRDLYRSFASKKDLFGEAVHWRCAEFLKAGEVREERQTSPTLVLTNLGHRLIEMAVHPDAVALQRAVIGDLERHPKLGAWLIEASYGAATDLLAPRLKLWHQQGRMRVTDPRESAAEFVECAVGRFLGRALMGADGAPSRKLVARHLNVTIENFLNQHA